jgi:cell division GTPase FtsZ
MAIEMIEEFDQGTQIKVIGVGGGGGNAVEHMIAQGIEPLQSQPTVAVGQFRPGRWCQT